MLTFALILPVKDWSRAKTRLVPPYPVTNADLASAFARDALAAAIACPPAARVYVVTSDPGFLPDGAIALPDEGGGDLNAALTAAEARVRAECDLPVAALCADLPCLTPADLRTGLAGDGISSRWFVADAAGTGTTLLAALPGTPLAPAFGPRSAERHRRSGAAPLADPVPTLRLDVDTAEDLSEAVSLGVGSATAALLAGKD